MQSTLFIFSTIILLHSFLSQAAEEVHELWVQRDEYDGTLCKTSPRIIYTDVSSCESAIYYKNTAQCVAFIGIDLIKTTGSKAEAFFDCLQKKYEEGPMPPK